MFDYLVVLRFLFRCYAIRINTISHFLKLNKNSKYNQNFGRSPNASIAERLGSTNEKLAFLESSS